MEPQAQSSLLQRVFAFVRLCILGCLGLLLVGIPILRMVIANQDMGMANGVTMALSFLAVGLLAVWFLTHPGISILRKLLLAFIPIACVAALASQLQFVGFSGAMVPQFRWKKGGVGSTPLATKPPQADGSLGDSEVVSSALQFDQFLGPKRTGVIADVVLESDWKSHPPVLEWKVDCGAGWAGMAVVDQRVVTIEQVENEEWVTCRSLVDGKLLWKSTTPARHYNVLGGLGPRGTPTISAGKVFALGATGHVVCLDLATGKIEWEKELLKIAENEQAEFEIGVAWGRAASPLLVRDQVILPLGDMNASDPRSLIAFDRTTGEIRWKAGSKQIGYSSPMVVTLAGIECLVIVNEDSVTGHRVEDGSLLWELAWPGQSNGAANCSQPIAIDDHQLLVTKGYGSGSVLLDFSATDGKLEFKQVWRKPALLRTKFTSAVFDGKYAYGLSDGVLECVDVALARREWKDGRYGHGQVLLVGKHLLISSEAGELVLVAATPDGYRELASVPVLEGITWNIPSLVGDRCLIRNATSMACMKLPLQASASQQPSETQQPSAQ